MLATQRLTFEQYLEWDDSTDNRYELVDGRLTELPPESESNSSLANFLFLQLVNAGVPFRQVHPHACEVQVPVLQVGEPANRYPDVVILRKEHLELTRKRLTITCDMLPPHLVVEVVSPGEQNRVRDYDRKRIQYAARGIPEYWIVDPPARVVTVLALDRGRYLEMGKFAGNERILSPELTRMEMAWSLTVDRVLSAVG